MGFNELSIYSNDLGVRFSRQCLGYYLWHGIYPAFYVEKKARDVHLCLSLNLAVKRNNLVSMVLGG